MPQRPVRSLVEAASVGGVGAQYFNAGTPQKMEERPPYDPAWRLDAKVAALPVYKYDDKDTKARLLKVKDYFSSQCSDLELLLDWAESEQHEEIIQQEVKVFGLALDVDPVQASERI